MRESDEPLHLHEYPDEDDVSSIDLTDTVPCPKCRKPVYEGAHHCPGCGTYILWEDEDRASRRGTILIAAIVLAAMLGGIVVMLL